MPKSTCPYCGRRQPEAPRAALVTCDGCERPFDPAKVVHRPAAIWKRIAGTLLQLLGPLGLLALARIVASSDFRDRDTLMELAGAAMIPGLLFFAASSLKRGRIVVEEAATDPPSKDIPEI